MDVECKWPGSVHDAKVFANSSLCRKLQSGEIHLSPYNLLPGYDALPNYIIGDPAYPPTPFCMKEFQTCEENKHVIYNNMIRSARNQIECAFGRLKGRWRILTRNMDLKLEKIPIVVYSCFVLHNFCESKNENTVENDEVEAQINRHNLEEQANVNYPDPIFSHTTDEGEYIRNLLCRYIQDNLPDGY